MVTDPRRSEGGTTSTNEDTSDRQRYSVLIADDDRGNRETLGEILTSRGFRIVLAADGEEAVELVQVDLVHLILFDMHMPGLTGLEAFAVIRQTLDRVLPAVLMTADANTELIRRAFAAQMYSVIPKPVSTNVVLHTLERALMKVYGPRVEPQKHAEAGGVGGNPLGVPPTETRSEPKSLPRPAPKDTDEGQ